MTTQIKCFKYRAQAEVRASLESHTSRTDTTYVGLVERRLPRHWPRYITLRQLFISYLDVFSVPRRSFFEWLSHFTTSELETEKLREYVSTSEGQEEMFDYATRPRRTIFEVLQEFRSAHGQIGLEYIADIFPEIRPRQFSIASSCKKEGNKKRVELLVAIVRYKTKLQAPRKGVATSWLRTLEAGTVPSCQFLSAHTQLTTYKSIGRRIPCSFVTGSMRLPSDPATPTVLIGPGTGIAPFRAFVQERLALDPDARGTPLPLLDFFGGKADWAGMYLQKISSSSAVGLHHLTSTSSQTGHPFKSRKPCTSFSPLPGTRRTRSTSNIE